MKATIQQLQEEYQNYIVNNRIAENRERRNVMARFAFMVAGRELYSTLELARITGKNHATVIHASKGHEMNLRFDSDYMRFFNQSCAIIDKLRGSDEGGLDWDLTKDNAQLRERLEKTRQELLTTREMLYIKEQEIKQLKKNYELCD